MELRRLDDPTQPCRDPDDPWLPAEPCSPSQVRVWCRYCDAYHLHGWEPAGTVSHKRAHCWIDDTPYRVTGYSYLVLPEGTVPAPAPAQRRKPRYVGDKLLHGWLDEPSVLWREAVLDRLAHSS
jgi:hypothetical protein